MEFASRFPRKIYTALQKEWNVSEEKRTFCFACFNFAGLPGTDDSLTFRDKTIGKEMEDARGVIQALQERYTPKWMHVIGLSTGAILTSLLRGEYPATISSGVSMTFTAIAGLLDLQKGIKYDFSTEQQRDFQEKGFCWKEFYLPKDVSSPVDARASPTMAGKVYFALDQTYVEEYGVLDIRKSVTRKDCFPFLVLHGQCDTNVPIADGRDLYETAETPKEWTMIQKGNHLFSNSRSMQLALRALLAFTTKYEG